MFFIVALMSIPLPSLIVPTFTFLANVGLTNSLFGLSLLYAAYQIPIAVWILYGYFSSLPVELEHAALIDGYSRFATLRKIVLPLSGPGLVAAGLFVVTFAWNDFVVAVAMISSPTSRRCRSRSTAISASTVATGDRSPPRQSSRSCPSSPCSSSSSGTSFPG